MTGSDLQHGVSVELVQEVHDGVSLQRGRADHHVLLCLRPVAAVRSAKLLSLQPRQRQLLELKQYSAKMYITQAHREDVHHTSTSYNMLPL